MSKLREFMRKVRNNEDADLDIEVKVSLSLTELILWIILFIAIIATVTAFIIKHLK